MELDLHGPFDLLFVYCVLASLTLNSGGPSSPSQAKLSLLSWLHGLLQGRQLRHIGHPIPEYTTQKKVRRTPQHADSEEGGDSDERIHQHQEQKQRQGETLA